MYRYTYVAIPEDWNVTQNDAENKLKYTRLCTKDIGTWNMKCFIIPEFTGTSGIVTQNF